MSTLAATVQVGNFPEGFKGNIQEHANQLVALMTILIDAGLLQGQVGGSKPTSDIGLWLNGTDLEVWNPDTSAYQSLSSVPIGSIFAFAGSTIPDNYLLCDGRSVARATYPLLFGAIGTSFGTAGSTVFNLPDLRGRFPLGAGTGVAYADDTSPIGATSTGGMNAKTLTNFYGQESIQKVIPPGNTPSTAKRVADSALVPFTGNSQTQGLPPCIALNYLIRSS